MSELGSVSPAILDYVNSQQGYISQWQMINKVSREQNVSHTLDWWFRRLLALALEGQIDVTLYRQGDKTSFKFKRLQEGPIRTASILFSEIGHDLDEIATGWSQGEDALIKVGLHDARRDLEELRKAITEEKG